MVNSKQLSSCKELQGSSAEDRRVNCWGNRKKARSGARRGRLSRDDLWFVLRGSDSWRPKSRLHDPFLSRGARLNHAPVPPEGGIEAAFILTALRDLYCVCVALIDASWCKFNGPVFLPILYWTTERKAWGSLFYPSTDYLHFNIIILLNDHILLSLQEGRCLVTGCWFHHLQLSQLSPANLIIRSSLTSMSQTEPHKPQCRSGLFVLFIFKPRKRPICAPFPKEQSSNFTSMTAFQMEAFRSYF